MQILAAFFCTSLHLPPTKSFLDAHFRGVDLSVLDIRTCRPDLVELSVAPGMKKCKLKIVDIKSAHSVSAGHRLQVGWYYGVIDSFISKSDLNSKVTLDTCAELWARSAASSGSTTSGDWIVHQCSVERSWSLVQEFFRDVVPRLAMKQKELSDAFRTDCTNFPSCRSWFGPNINWKLSSRCISCPHLEKCKSFCMGRGWSDCRTKAVCGMSSEMLNRLDPLLDRSKEKILEEAPELLAFGDVVQALRDRVVVDRHPIGSKSVGVLSNACSTTVLVLAVVVHPLSGRLHCAGGLSLDMNPPNVVNASPIRSFGTRDSLVNFVVECANASPARDLQCLVWNSEQASALCSQAWGDRESSSRVLLKEDFGSFVGDRGRDNCPATAVPPPGRPRLLSRRVLCLNDIIADCEVLPLPAPYTLADATVLIPVAQRPQNMSGFDVFENIISVAEGEAVKELPDVAECSRHLNDVVGVLSALFATIVRRHSASLCISRPLNKVPLLVDPKSGPVAQPTDSASVLLMTRDTTQYAACSRLTQCLDERAQRPVRLVYSPLSHPPKTPSQYFARFVVANVRGNINLSADDHEWAAHAIWERDDVGGVRPRCTKCRSAMRVSQCAKTDFIEGNATGRFSAECGRLYVQCGCGGGNEAASASAESPSSPDSQSESPTKVARSAGWCTLETHQAAICRHPGCFSCACRGCRLLLRILHNAKPTRPDGALRDEECMDAHPKSKAMALPTEASLCDVMAVEHEPKPQGGSDLDLVVYLAISKSRIRLSLGAVFLLSPRYVDWNTPRALQALKVAESVESPILRLCFRAADGCGPSHARSRTVPRWALSLGLTDSQKEVPNALLHLSSPNTQDPTLVLVQGPPGTGKTHTVMSSVLALLDSRQDRPTYVLVCAFTNRALQMLADKLVEILNAQSGPNGMARNLNLQGFHYCTDDRRFDLSSKDAKGGPRTWGWKQRQRAAKEDTFTFPEDGSSVVVFGTVWTAFKRGYVGDPPAPLRSFDVLILDEASQMPLGEAIIPSLLLKAYSPDKPEPRYVLVAGDFMQLPPILNADFSAATNSQRPFLGSVMQALMLREDGSRLVDPSVPERGTAAIPWRDLVVLRESRRSTPEIAKFVERLYPMGLCSLRPSLPLQPAVPSRCNKDLRCAVADACSNALAVVKNVPPSRESELVAAIADTLVCLGVRRIAIVTLHRVQRDSITAACGALLAQYSDMTVDTVERMQGSEADAVILALSVDVERDPQFIFNLPRLNVALSRACSRLIVVLSKSVECPPAWVVMSCEAVERGFEHITEFCRMAFLCRPLQPPSQ